MENENKIIFFLKFGEEKFMKDLFKNGTIYFNTFDFFQKCEEESGRGDKLEGCLSIQNYNLKDNMGIKFYFPEGEFLAKAGHIQLVKKAEDIKANAYCLYAIGSSDLDDKNEFKVDDKMLKTGKYCVAITNTPAFIDRIRAELEKQNIRHEEGLVNYYDENQIHGEISMFEKRKQYNFQKEYRIVIENHSGQPVPIKIGSIEDIAKIIQLDPLPVQE